MDAKSCIKHLRYLKLMSDLVQLFPGTAIFYVLNEHLHFPLFCQSIYLTWRPEPLIPVAVVVPSLHDEALKLIDPKCTSCSGHLQDAVRSRVGAMSLS